MKQNLSQDLNEVREKAIYLREIYPSRGNSKHKDPSVESQTLK